LYEGSAASNLLVLPHEDLFDVSRYLGRDNDAVGSDIGVIGRLHVLSVAYVPVVPPDPAKQHGKTNED
jgi:hypothetical protein